MLEIFNLNAWRDDRCLYAELSFTARPGEVLHIQGANGAGKTTLLQQLAGLRSAPTQSVRWQQQSAHALESDFVQQLIYLGHLPGLKAALTVAENLTTLAALRQHRVDAEQIDQALLTVGLYGYDDTPVRQLSAGQKRRVALARLYLEPAKIWLLDEPFSSLDRQGVADLESGIASFAAAGGTVLLTTHHQLSDRCPVQILNLSQYAYDESDNV